MVLRAAWFLLRSLWTAKREVTPGPVRRAIEPGSADVVMPYRLAEKPSLTAHLPFCSSHSLSNP